MSIDHFSQGAQQGLRRWSADNYGDQLMLDGISGANMAWAWIAFLLRESEDKPEWFPNGKSSTIQRLEEELIREAREEIRGIAG
jgi:hypothetical protein